MQIIKSLPRLLLFLLPVSAFSQTTYLMPGSKEYILLDRLEIKSNHPTLNFSTVKPYARRSTVKAVEALDSMSRMGTDSLKLSAVDRYNMERFLMNNSEWSTPRESFKSRKPFLKYFYKTKGNGLEVHNGDDYHIIANPIIQYQQSKERGNDQNVFLNSRGVNVRGLIDRRVGFNLYLTENQERAPLYVQDLINQRKAVPGQGFYKTFKGVGGTDYFDIRGSVSWNVARFIDMQFGYDRNFTGTGHRSLFMSDNTNNALFLKINTRLWKFNYQSILMELIPDHKRTGGGNLPRKYYRMNHLSVNATKWLNVGLYEGVMFGRKDHFDFLYLNPVMFIRPAEQQIGSPDNAVVGLDVKANIKKTVQLYSQVVFDEFILSELKSNRGYWANKFGYQIGAKYIDAFTIKNLDLQVEANRVRPFTYSHFDSVANYTHYNQPFAHILGSNFQEYIAIAKYQPINRLYLQAKLIHYYQGLDSGGVNFGSNPLRNYKDRSKEFGYDVGSGNKVTATNLTFLASYELFENLFIDGQILRRNADFLSGSDKKTTVLSLGVRWNMARRDFDF